ncbi:MAG TPA: adenylate/guanylate cyclase domain-containing protein, partial [Candidatus Tumulicola sp.]|nr:adenylate/guanylate cyclase domain-containing protein [Candidatus Tumulicola sp.]
MTAGARPTGAVTFLFSDVEGSTQRWERSRDAMSVALQRHDVLLQTAIEAHHGYVFKRVGDAFCAAFTRPPDAAAAAIDAQRMLAAEDFTAVDGLRVRMALHAGQSEERDGDYFGGTVNRVARLLAIGHGAQVLVSGVTAELLGDELPQGCSLRDLGMHRLKDLGQPEHAFALVAQDLRSEFPALRSLDGTPNNLPVQLTSFVGREAELSELKALLQHERLVTLVGTGGSGKTRCALQIAAESLDAFADGAWLVELAPIADASLAAAAIGEALNLQLAPNRPALDSVVAYCRRKSLLVVMDNCEHLLAEVRGIVSAILQQCPDARILATSRESFNLPGERAFRMPSLPVPPVLASMAADDALKYAAAALFATRAVSADSRFAVTDENAAVVAEICRRLDGIPFAIELAAARVKVLSPKQLSQKLDERFRLLTGGNPMALPRQQTMRALIDWSYDLLSDAERALFRKLAIFAGGFTLEIATATCATEELDELAILDILASLVDKSLVSADASDEATRYSLLESTRQYAREKLAESGEYSAVARAHAVAMLAFAERLEANHPGDREWNARAEPELDNWRTALDWAFGEGGDVLLGQRLASTLGRAWSNLAPSEGRRRIGEAIGKIDAATPPDVVADLHLAEAQICGVLGLHKACLDAALVALERYEALGDRLGVAKARRHAGRALVFAGDAAGEALLREALETFRACGERPLIGAALENLAIA